VAPIVTLTTDFGLSDSYVASIKGVILSINPKARLVDISHQVPPQDILHGAFVLATAWSYFPRGTIHLAVVDPGVGTRRKAIAVSHKGHTFLAPDNGILSLALGGVMPSGSRAIAITNPRYRLKRVSSTFHGRDIFAPAAAYLSRGLALGELGPALYRIKSLRVATPIRQPDGSLQGSVIHVDAFGNLVTNIRRGDARGDITVRVGGRTIAGLSATYAASEGFLALWGSSDYLEIAVRDGNARRALKVKRGDPVLVRPRR
jgi:S-adenosylmethionine hydrolase